MKRALGAMAVAAGLVSAVVSTVPPSVAGATVAASTGRVAFERSGDIWVMQEDGNGEQRLTDVGDAAEPTWAPDGSRIAFARDGDIWSIADDGSDLRLESAATAYEFAPAWSPDGSRIAFLRQDPAGGSLVAVHRASGTVQVLVPAVQETWFGMPIFMRAAAGRPAWSPDGRFIAVRAFEVSQGAPTPRGSILVSTAPLTGTGQAATTEAGDGPFEESGAVTWSPDGGRIAIDTATDPCRTPGAPPTASCPVLRIRILEGPLGRSVTTLPDGTAAPAFEAVSTGCVVHEVHQTGTVVVARSCPPPVEGGPWTTTTLGTGRQPAPEPSGAVTLDPTFVDAIVAPASGVPVLGAAAVSAGTPYRIGVRGTYSFINEAESVSALESTLRAATTQRRGAPVASVLADAECVGVPRGEPAWSPSGWVATDGSDPYDVYVGTNWDGVPAPQPRQWTPATGMLPGCDPNHAYTLDFDVPASEDGRRWSARVYDNDDRNRGVVLLSLFER